MASTTTGPDGRYRFTDLEPGVPVDLRFRDPASGVVWGTRSTANTARRPRPAAHPPCPVPAAAGATTRLLHLVLAPGQELTEQSLPVRPTGSGLRQPARATPLPGAVVVAHPTGSCPAWDPATQVAGAGLGGYTVVAGNSIRMTTGQQRLLPVPAARQAHPRVACTQLVVEPPPAWQFPSDD
jgi:hypothetical protein